MEPETRVSLLRLGGTLLVVNLMLLGCGLLLVPHLVGRWRRARKPRIDPERALRDAARHEALPASPVTARVPSP
ncbi:MAG: hypothetical protein IT371_17785 [Deltaproteobacteria bacterium]|nr:hypothetical protein [Deltaproteobacteria bacterium]